MPYKGLFYCPAARSGRLEEKKGERNCMAITRSRKEEVVREVSDAVAGSESVVFVSFKKLTVAETSAMRKSLRALGVRYLVAKKTLARRAFEAGGFAGELPELPGEFALVYGTDPVAPAREVNVFVKKNKDRLSIVGGIFEKKFMNASEMQTIAMIPPLQTLYAQFVNVINSPIQGLVFALDAIAAKKES